MLKISREENVLKITVSAKKTIDLNLLNYIASGENSSFMKVKYFEEKEKHIFTYFCETSDVLSKQISYFGFDKFCELLKAYVSLVYIMKEKDIKFDNVIWDMSYIACNNGQYQFVCMPFDGEKKATLRKNLLKQIDALQQIDSRLSELSQGIKGLKSDEEVIKYCEVFILKYDNKEIISIEEETSVLSSNGVDEQELDEGETTVLSSDISSYDINLFATNTITKTTQFLENEFSESETTLFSGSETTVLQSNETENEDNNAACLLSIIENRTGARTTVNKNVFMIGKDSFHMDYVVLDNSVSRHHATITYEDGSYYIMDNKSTNGTTIEGVILQPFEKAELYNGSIISLGNVTFQIKLERRV